jgi:exodeoxyribonuclease VII large subunit
MPEASNSLSHLLGQVQRALRNEFTSAVWIVAEILELHENRNGHCYLELIEKSSESDSILARAKGTIWASRYSMLRPFFEASTGTALKSGIKLLCKVSVEFHPQYGLSLNITDIDPAYTLGDLARKKQEVILRLREEGVFQMNKELSFPEVPQRIAIISSDSAAGYGDFMESIRHNAHGFHFQTTLFPAVMQGDQVPGSITSAMDKIYENLSQFDCVVIIRGGGSKADLESFNHYDLAYYITQFPLPVITGIGHERDESVADMVAFYGLKTPTAVAEFLVDQLLTFEFRLGAKEDQLTSLVRRIVQKSLSRLEQDQNNIKHLSYRFLQHRNELIRTSEHLLRKEVFNQLERKKDYLAHLEKRRELVDPEQILKRGYTMTLLEGKPISSMKDVQHGDLLETRVHKGKIISKVEQTIITNGKRKN